MVKTNTESRLEQNFKELIVERCKFCGFDKYLAENPDFEFPKIDKGLLGWENSQHIAIPGMFGGFDYFLEEVDNNLVLYAERSSRMDHDSNSYSIFEIGIGGARLLEGEERRVVWKKFRQLDKKRLEEHRQEAVERRKHKPSDEGEQRILGYDLDGNPQSFCWSAFWQVLICASGEHKRNEILQKLLKYDNYADYKIITLEQKSRGIDTVLTDLVGDIRERYAIVSKTLKAKAINGYPSFYEPYLAHNSKSNVLLIIKEPTKWRPDFYRDNEEALQEILRLCGRVGIRVIITDKYENVPPNIRIFMSTIIAKLGFEE